ncbi:MAG: bifunctional diaminohydroxyphosphoribosylaminopyrimidine deaminase/5-amino-6-(5-phosphoribosylamino)uracil reductase RibD [Oscillospiraceae bacterium]|nr:bifunctional diaminohydroxyphosphoribosylaminopyrimidine deaminase/5-amino-6-(5-phosphoribosylamino)uracil reductase RibD [Oscillospiraceae bacterium]
MTHEHWMCQALELAALGRGQTNPNPMVGAVIVRDGRVIGAGYHKAYGGPHAEREALAACTENPSGADMYVTLEPCCHHGKTPPCTDAILAAGIARVIVGSSDPNPKVAGGGVAALRAAGVAVIEGVLQAECDRVNRVFFHYIQTSTPYMVLKYAMTADGKIATRTGASRWITGPAAREHVHETRHALSAILVGVGTVLADDPLLTCRLPHGRNPVRVVCDSRLSTPLDSQIVTTANEIPTIIATAGQRDADTAPYRAAGCKVFALSGPDGRVDLTALMHALHADGIDSVLVEGGAAIHYSMLQAGLAKRLQVYMAPKLFGGITAKSPVGGEGVALPDEAFRLGPPEVTVLGKDLLLEYDILGGGP